jgi:CRP-like cAMP-binding protein
MPPGIAHRPVIENLLLGALPATLQRKLFARGERVDITPATVLHQAGMPVVHVYFPIDGSVALVAGATGEVKLEIGMVGNEGMLGISVMLGVPAASQQWLVQSGGLAWRIEVAPFLASLSRSPQLRQQLNHYLHVRLSQLAQTSVCKRFHVVEERLARWLLMIRDRAHGNAFHVTHAGLAHVLGVRRAGITLAAGSLQKRLLIRYVRGELQILDGAGLERAACGCYAADKQIYASTMALAH